MHTCILPCSDQNFKAKFNNFIDHADPHDLRLECGLLGHPIVGFGHLKVLAAVHSVGSKLGHVTYDEVGMAYLVDAAKPLAESTIKRYLRELIRWGLVFVHTPVSGPQCLIWAGQKGQEQASAHLAELEARDDALRAKLEEKKAAARERAARSRAARKALRDGKSPAKRLEGNDSCADEGNCCTDEDKLSPSTEQDSAARKEESLRTDGKFLPPVQMGVRTHTESHTESDTRTDTEVKTTTPKHPAVDEEPAQAAVVAGVGASASGKVEAQEPSWDIHDDPFAERVVNTEGLDAKRWLHENGVSRVDAERFVRDDLELVKTWRIYLPQEMTKRVIHNPGAYLFAMLDRGAQPEGYIADQKIQKERKLAQDHRQQERDQAERQKQRIIGIATKIQDYLEDLQENDRTAYDQLFANAWQMIPGGLRVGRAGESLQMHNVNKMVKEILGLE